MALASIKLRNLGAKGVISDLAPYDTDVSSWTDADNIRFNNGRAIKIGGYIPLFYNNRQDALDWGGLRQIPMHLVVHPDAESTWIYCTENTIWNVDGWSHVNMHPEPYYPTGTVVSKEEFEQGLYKTHFEFEVALDAPWSSTTISNSVILSSTNLPEPIGLNKGDALFRPLPNWGPGSEWKATTIRSFKNFVMVVGGGEDYPQRVRWSDFVPPNALPSNWGWKYLYDATDVAAGKLIGQPIPPNDPQYGKFIESSAGGYNDLSFARGHLVDGRVLRDQFVIYTDSEVITCDYVGGNDIFRFRSLFDDGGAINPDCIANFENKHFVVSDHDVYVHNGSTKESVIDGKIRTRLLEEITATSPESVKVVPYLAQNEIWVIYPGPDAQIYEGAVRREATRAAIFNYLSGAWTFARIPRTFDLKLGPTPIYNEENKIVDTWDKVAETFRWEDSTELWNLVGGSSASNLKNHSLVSASSDGGFYALDLGSYFTDLGPKDPTTGKYTYITNHIISSLSKDYIDMDEVTETINYKTILAIWPQTIGTGELYIQVGGAEIPGGSTTWGPATRFTCGESRKVDIRENHRYLCLNIEGRGVGDWSLSGVDIVYRAGGKR